MTSTTTYTCDGYRAIKAGATIRWNDGDFTVECVEDAAKAFATRMARAAFGRKGICHHVRLDSWREDRTSYTFEAFIGYPAEGGGYTGRNEWLFVKVRQ
jgi:hypothetical protein